MTDPIPMILFCPLCGGRHVDRGEFATRPHHTHACQDCGLPWRPAIVATVGVQFLPGFRDPQPEIVEAIRVAVHDKPACAFSGGCSYGSACAAAGICIRLERAS